MYEEISDVFRTANHAQMIKGERLTGGRGMVVNSGRIIVSLLGCFGDSCVLSATYNNVSGYRMFLSY